MGQAHKFQQYNIVNYPHDIVATVMNRLPLNISFRRTLVGDKLLSWHNLVAKIAGKQLSHGRDIGIYIDMGNIQSDLSLLENGPSV